MLFFSGLLDHCLYTNMITQNPLQQQKCAIAQLTLIIHSKTRCMCLTDINALGTTNIKHWTDTSSSLPNDVGYLNIKMQRAHLTEALLCEEPFTQDAFLRLKAAWHIAEE